MPNGGERGRRGYTQEKLNVHEGAAPLNPSPIKDKAKTTEGRWGASTKRRKKLLCGPCSYVTAANVPTCTEGCELESRLDGMTTSNTHTRATTTHIRPRQSSQGNGTLQFHWHCVPTSFSADSVTGFEESGQSCTAWMDALTTWMLNGIIDGCVLIRSLRILRKIKDVSDTCVGRFLEKGQDIGQLNTQHRFLRKPG